ncbi:hypothetical protein C4565_05200 [Candidatus Parcubacteria bacterium]|nr:MAG: hypothetical protein C4565_05200 [Candidatus Parcubacteria bacterium]
MAHQPYRSPAANNKTQDEILALFTEPLANMVQLAGTLSRIGRLSIIQLSCPAGSFSKLSLPPK